MSQNDRKTTHHYPLMQTEAETLKTASGRTLNEVNLEALLQGQLTLDDLRINAETLQAQAEIAHEAGYTQLAQNLTRAAELTRVPNEELLAMYEQLRPRRATFDELIALAQTLEEKYAAPETARLVRDAASVYQERGLLRRESED